MCVRERERAVAHFTLKKTRKDFSLSFSFSSLSLSLSRTPIYHHGFPLRLRGRTRQTNRREHEAARRAGRRGGERSIVESWFLHRWMFERRRKKEKKTDSTSLIEFRPPFRRSSTRISTRAVVHRDARPYSRRDSAIRESQVPPIRATSSFFSFFFFSKRVDVFKSVVVENSTVENRERERERNNSASSFFLFLSLSLPTPTAKKNKRAREQAASQLAPPPPPPRRRIFTGVPRSPKPRRRENEPVRRSGRLDGKPPRSYSEDPAAAPSAAVSREVRKLKGGSGSRSIRERGKGERDGLGNSGGEGEKEKERKR